MEDLWEKWISSLEMGGDNSIGQSHLNSTDEEKFLTEILQLEQPNFSFDNNAYNSSIMQYNNNNNDAFTTSTKDSCLSYEEDEGQRNNMVKSTNSSSSIISQDGGASHKPSTSSFILSFEKSIVEPAIHRPSPKQFIGVGGGSGGGDTTTCSNSILCQKTTTLNDHCNEPMAKQRTKKFRTSSEAQDHIMAERKRRQEITERFIALSATIPGLKKTDKAYVLREAINYMKQLEERVKELENQNKRKTSNSVVFIKKSQASTKEETTSCEMNSDIGHRFKKALPQVEARVLEKEVLIGIHCEKQEDIVLRIVNLLQNLHLSLTSSSVLPFGTSNLKVTIIAQMGDKYCMNVNDLVKSLRQDLLKLHDNQK